MYKRVDEHYQFVKRNITNHILLFTFLTGSQNYNMEDSQSDVDTKSVLIPNFEALIFDKEKLSKTLIVEPTIEHADVKDLRKFFEILLKQNPAYLETLFSKVAIINKEYQDYYNELVAIREDIAHYNRFRFLKTSGGNIINKYKQLQHPFPAAEEKIHKYGYDPKQLAHMMRMKELMIRYVKEEPFKNILIPSDPQLLIAVKRGSIPLEEALKISKDIMEWLKKFELNNKYEDISNSYIEKKLEEMTYGIFRKAYY